MKSIYVVSAGIAVPFAAANEGFAAAIQQACARTPRIALTSNPPSRVAVPAKDKRILTDDDLLAADAGMTAMQLAGFDNDPQGLGCVVFTTGKGTRAAERRQQRTAYRDDQDRPDVRRFADAIARGDEVVDPFILLKDLDNSLIWWICKTYGICDFNIQINQTIEPDYHALLEGISALEDGLCQKLLVGGVQLAEREEVAVPSRHEVLVRNAADASVFFGLMAAEDAPPGALARVSLWRRDELIGKGCRDAQTDNEGGRAGSIGLFTDLVYALPVLSEKPMVFGSSTRPWAVAAEAVL